MRALYFDGALELREDYPDPAPIAGESLVRVTLAGICGTDLELARGYMAFCGVPGHEFTGRVVQSANPAVVGRRVVGEINAGCGRCRSCADGMARHCPNRTVLGILGRDGAFADYLRLPDGNLKPVPDSIADEAAVFVEPLAAAFEIFEQAAFKRSDRIAILGGGRLGAIVAMALRSEDFAPVVAGRERAKLARLEKLGLTVAAADTLEPGFDVVIDCTGNPAGFARSIALVRPRGTIVLKSTAAAGAAMNLAPIVINEISVIGSRCGRFEPALRALAAGRIDPRPLIDKIVPLADGAGAFALAADKAHFKILLRPS
jgi:threonine dehydrogenase-like Zn-dependent dehydrogenase